ncbi:hypothetical protein N9L76_11010, partial [bacterium]|nr:hypothetical protein [bacterium]
TLRDGFRSGIIRPQWAVSAAMGWNNGSAAAVALGSVGDWLAATRCRLKAVDEVFPVPCRDASEENAIASHYNRHEAETELALTVSEYATRAGTAPARAAAIGAVAGVWRARLLSPSRLEGILLSDVDAVGAEALTLLLHRDREVRRRGVGESGPGTETFARTLGDPVDDSDGEKKLGFSASFALAAASLRVKAASRDALGDTKRDDDKIPTTRQDNDGSRWSRARAALTKDAGKSTCIRYAAPTSSDKITENAMVFSCGHVVAAEQLAITAAAFARELTTAGCPMSGELVATEYAMNKCALACPKCASLAVHAAYGVGSGLIAAKEE